MNDRKPILPPRYAERFLRWFLRKDLGEEVQGDLEEQFYATLAKKPVFKAKLNYWYQVFNYLRPFAISKSKSTSSNHYAMYRNYFKIALRNLVKQKLYSIVNIGGLATGLTSFILILLFVQHELSYDRFYKNGDQIYRIYQRQIGNVYLGSDYFAVTPAQLPSVMLDEFPEVTHATSVNVQSELLSYRGHHFLEKGLGASTQFFDVFAFPFIHGNPHGSLEKPGSMVITASLATKLFGDKNPIGLDINLPNEDPFTVTGVISDPPANSTLKFSFVKSLQSDRYYLDQLNRPKWNNNSFHTFLVLAKGASPGAFQKKLQGIIKKYQEEDYPFKDKYIVQPLSEIHLQADVNFDIGLKGNAKYVYMFSVIALIVLLLACFNYMNLAIARSINRAREVGLRKAIGALRWQLIGQFLGESILFAFLALLVALGLVYLLLPLFGQLVERPLTIGFLGNAFFLPGLLLLMVAVGLLSGSYPAFFMSSLRPVSVLKGTIEGRLSRFKMQRWLIVVQYVVSIALVISSLVIYSQLQYMQQKELGYDRGHIIAVKVQGRSVAENYEAIRNEWLQSPNLINVTASIHLPTNIASSTIINDEDGRSKEDHLAIYHTLVDYDFLDVFGIELVAGRNFSPEIASDIEEGYLINETAAKALGWTPEEAIGKQFTHNGIETVIGVMKDFHLHSMHLPIQPLMISMRNVPNRFMSFFSVKVRPEKLPETIALLQKTIKKHSPYPFNYQFLDDHFDQLYKSEMKLGETFGFFTILSLLIASLGLFGLAAFSAGQRTKEIGVRKALGASVRNIVTILTKDFLGLVSLGFLLAIPVSWYAMDQWLQDFAYRTDIEWWMFALAGLMAIVIANMTIGYQSVKAALKNPVESLKSE